MASEKPSKKRRSQKVGLQALAFTALTLAMEMAIQQEYYTAATGVVIAGILLFINETMTGVDMQFSREAVVDAAESTGDFVEEQVDGTDLSDTPFEGYDSDSKDPKE